MAKIAKPIKRPTCNSGLSGRRRPHPTSWSIGNVAIVTARRVDSRQIYGPAPQHVPLAHQLVTTVFISHPACLVHDMGEGHPEQPDRLRAIDRAMESEVFQMLARDIAPRAEISAIARVHPLDYIEAIRAATPTQGLTAVDDETSISPGSFEAALRSAGGAIFAVDEVMTRKVRNAFVATRPPGHHAEVATPRASASSTARPSPRVTLRRFTAPSASRSSISTSITATARSTSSGTTEPSCMPRRTKCRSFPARGR